MRQPTRSCKAYGMRFLQAMSSLRSRNSSQETPDIEKTLLANSSGAQRRPLRPAKRALARLLATYTAAAAV